MKRASNKSSAAGVEAAAAGWVARRDAGLTSVEREELDRWAADPRHARALARHDRAWAILDRPRRAGMAGVMVTELGAREQQRRRRQAGALIAALAVLLAVTAVRPWRSPADSSSLPAPPANAVVVLPEKKTLPDGSVVELKAGAEIAVDFNGEFRRVALRKGEAHFQVMSDRKRDFIVTADGIAVRAVGTAFSVQLERKQVDVLVTEGRVAVEPDDGGRKAEDRGGKAKIGLPDPPSAPSRLSSEILVDAGNRVVIDTARSEEAPAPAVIAVSSDELTQRLAWRAARLEFTGTRLAEAVALMNRHNRVRFVIDDPALAQVEVSGYFRADNTDAFLHLLEGSLGVKAQRSNDTIFLRKGP